MPFSIPGSKRGWISWVNADDIQASPAKKKRVIALRTLGPWIVIFLGFMSIRVSGDMLSVDPLLLGALLLFLAIMFIYPRVPG